MYMALVRTRSDMLRDLGIDEDKDSRLRRLMSRRRPVVSRKISVRRYSLPTALERRAPGKLKNFFTQDSVADPRMKSYVLRELGRGRKKKPRKTKKRRKHRTRKLRKKHRKRTYRKH